MKQEIIKKKTKTGIEVSFKNAEAAEAEDEINYLKQCCGETRFLLSEPEDVAYTVEGEEKFLEEYANSDNSLMLNAYINGRLIGNCSFAPISNANRLKHRCSMGIALIKKYCGQGIGELMLEILIGRAKEAGFEIMELDVVSANIRAKKLYERLGFVEYGVRKNAMKYKDGTYSDEILMALEL